jgi:hypothetical protein
MGKLQFYESLDDKRHSFNRDNCSKDIDFYKIDQAYQFNDWYNEMTTPMNNGTRGKYSTFYRGINEARFKLYNSAQRFWIQNNLMQMESLTQPIPYLQMIQNMVNKAKEVKLLQQVFEYYDIAHEQMDFPILSILQHYRAPTPLIDWTYDINIALYFAVLDVKRCEKSDVIDDYISIYRLDKNIHNSFLKDNLNYISANIFPGVSGLGNILLANNSAIYISDFEIADIQDKISRQIKPLTTYYNLNILAQKGIFVFNPHQDLPFEDFPKFHSGGAVDNKIYCYNISKDLAELIKLKISGEGVNKELLFPDLERYSRNILDDYLRFVAG